jgi:hypothetical protein
MSTVGSWLHVTRAAGVAGLLALSMVGVASAQEAEETPDSSVVDDGTTDDGTTAEGEVLPYTVEGTVLAVNGNVVLVQLEDGTLQGVIVPDGVHVAPGMMIDATGQFDAAGGLVADEVFAGVGVADDGNNGLHLGQLKNVRGTVVSSDGTTLVVQDADGGLHTFSQTDGTVYEVGATIKVHGELNEEGALSAKQVKVKLEKEDKTPAEDTTTDGIVVSETHGNGNGQGNGNGNQLSDGDVETDLGGVEDEHPGNGNANGHDEDEDEDKGNDKDKGGKKN